MSEPVKSHELPALVAKAVEQALAKREMSEQEINHLLSGPITIGILASEKTPGISAASATGAGESRKPSGATPLKIPFIGACFLNGDSIKSDLEKK